MGFTSGVFDLPHPGHIDVISAARSRGAMLIVATDDDGSVRRGEADARLVCPQAERTSVLAATANIERLRADS